MRGELRGPRLPAIFRASVRRGWSSHPPLPLMSHHARLLQRELASLVARRNFCSFPAVPRLSASALYCLARVLRPAPALLLAYLRQRPCAHVGLRRPHLVGFLRAPYAYAYDYLPDFSQKESCGWFTSPASWNFSIHG